MKILTALIFIAIFGAILGVSTSKNKRSSLRYTNEQSETNTLPFIINETYPYTLKAVVSRKGAQYYTEGLSFLDSNILVESAGLYGESGIHKINYKTQEIIQSQSLDKKYFGEGCDFITLANGTKEIYQMTWKEGKVFVFNGEDLSLIRTLNFPSEIAEGWGMVKKNHTIDGVQKEIFLVTEGSNRVFLVDPTNFTVLKYHQIKYNGFPLNMLNELEIVDGKLWVNIYLQSTVAEINMDTWTVERMIDFTEIKNYAKQHFTADIWDSGYCLNGIAYLEGNSETSSKIILTGKKWDYFFEIKMK